MAAAYGGVYLLADSPAVLYLLMGVLGIGWAAIVSLPFSIMSQRVDPPRISLYMGVFKLSIPPEARVTSTDHGADRP